jgi:hypothetical protein
VQLSSELPLRVYEQVFWGIDRLIGKNYPHRGPILVEAHSGWYVRHPDSALGRDELPRLIDEVVFLGVPGLSLAGLTRVSSAGFRALTELHRAGESLEILDLFNTRVAGRDLVDSLRGFTGLRSLHLAGTGVSAAALAELVEKLPRLQKLHLGWTEIDDQALAVIAQFRDLTDLDLRETKVSDEGLLSLQSLGNLKCLGLQGLSITDRGVDALRDMASLTRLDLSHTEITNRSVEALTTLRALDTLVMRATRVGMDQHSRLRAAAPGLAATDGIVR